MKSCATEASKLPPLAIASRACGLASMPVMTMPSPSRPAASMACSAPSAGWSQAAHTALMLPGSGLAARIASILARRVGDAAVRHVGRHAVEHLDVGEVAEHRVGDDAAHLHRREGVEHEHHDIARAADAVGDIGRGLGGHGVAVGGDVGDEQRDRRRRPCRRPGCRRPWRPRGRPRPGSDRR